MSSGAKRSTFYIAESTPGQTPDTGDWTPLVRTSYGVGPTFNTTETDEIGSDRMSQGTTQTTVDVGGDVGQVMHYGNLDDFLSSCFGADWQVDTPSAGTDSLTMGELNKTFSLASEDNDIGVYSVSRGCTVGSMQLTFGNDGEITATTTFAGRGFESSDSASFVGSKGPSLTTKRFDFKNVSGLTMNGTALAGTACVDNFSITFDNNLQTQRCIGAGDGFPGNQIATRFSAAGQIVLAWSPTAYSLYAQQKTNERVPFEFTIGNDEGSYTFSFPSVELSGDWPDGGATDIVQVTLDLSAAVTPPTIARTPA